jgi:hypothetical protein
MALHYRWQLTIVFPRFGLKVNVPVWLQLGIKMKLMAKQENIEVKVTNKTRRNTSTSQMSLPGVPKDVMMVIFGHRNTSSLYYYNNILKISRKVAMQSMILARDATSNDP